jgi:hypothetical protein
MTYDHEAIYRSHPNVVRIKDGIGAFDASGNQVTLDQSLVDAASSTIEEERSWSELRKERNRRLIETDYLALTDFTLSPEMAAYRQALRDLPSNTSNPMSPVWPVKPA